MFINTCRVTKCTTPCHQICRSPCGRYIKWTTASWRLSRTCWRTGRTPCRCSRSLLSVTGLCLNRSKCAHSKEVCISLCVHPRFVYTTPLPFQKNQNVIMYYYWWFWCFRFYYRDFIGGWPLITFWGLKMYSWGSGMSLYVLIRSYLESWKSSVIKYIPPDFHVCKRKKKES